MKKIIAFLANGLFFITGCASFAPMRSAQVAPGFSGDVKLGMTSSLSKEAYWLYDAGSDCPLCDSKPIAVSEVAFRYGIKKPGARGIQLGLVGNDMDAQLEFFSEVRQRPAWKLGGGLRLGLPLVASWASHQLFVVYERRLGENSTFCYAPGIYYHTGHSPNCMNHGSLFLLSQGLGLEFSTGLVSLTPAVTISVGNATVNIADEGQSSSMDVILAGSVSISLHRQSAN
ncbi:MAG: hypothetical protein D6814_14365 [Calditrichaeota bacterium]|nr:MAG: hypothetical protein D6814_14365 [Calditrichota bacterium]